MTFLVDLHVHTDRSVDGRSCLSALATAAAARGLNAIVLTDHDTLALSETEQYAGVWLLPGIECSTDAGHILGLLPDRPPTLPIAAPGSLPAAADVIAELHRCRAVTVLAHPYEKPSARPQVQTDAIECVNARASYKNPSANSQATALATTLGLPATGGSDAHSAQEVGNAYTCIEADACTPSALRTALQTGQCQPVLVRCTPRRFKGLSQFRKARRSRSVFKCVRGMIYLVYCVLFDLWKGVSE